ncbi:hypothetical protein EUGRSUZ_E04073 [Eucalyptus grandis]|uniref:Uncharacterized protein n=2 Tax=Eucalyptus grandis TaxID=71139 RepID=A0ACC3KZZ2_EUCGR|nr:hypothetical protein EUGRSUZ_E04073 [Eucalyptus grandis]
MRLPATPTIISAVDICLTSLAPYPKRDHIKVCRSPNRKVRDSLGARICRCFQVQIGLLINVQDVSVMSVSTWVYIYLK